MQALPHSNPGFFMPMPQDDGSLMVFRCTGDGFVPWRIQVTPLEELNAITFLGQQVVERQPVLKTWMAGSPASVPLEQLSRGKAPYRPLSRMRLESLYPSVEGYKDTLAVGGHARFSDPAMLNTLAVTASMTPTRSVSDEERMHLRAEYRRYELRERCPGPVVVDMFCLLRLELALSVQAKALLIMRKAGLKLPPHPDIGSGLAELRRLRQSVGPTGMLALAPPHVTTHRDDWHRYLVAETGTGTFPRV